MAETGRIRKKRNKFSQVSNHCLRNDKLTLKAKGLYALIQSFIDIPDFTLYKSVLMDKYCVEGREAFNNTWKELINAGYLKTYKVNTHNGFVYEYELLDEPEVEETPETPNDEGSGVDERNPITTKVRQLSPGTGNPYVGPGTAFPGVDSPGVGNPSLNNTNNNYTYTNNTNLFNYDDSNNLKDSNEVVEGIVVEQINKSNRNSLSFTQKEINDIEAKHLLNNVNLDSFSSDIGKEILNLSPELLPYITNFAIKYTGRKARIRMFDVEHLIHRYTIIAEVYQSTDVADEAMKLLNDVAESFINENRFTVLNFSKDTIKELYDQAIHICEHDDLRSSYIVDHNAYLARIFYSVLSRERKTIVLDTAALTTNKEFY